VIVESFTSGCLTFVSHAKTAEPIEMPFGRLTRVGPKNRVLNGIEITHGEAMFSRGDFRPHTILP